MTIKIRHVPSLAVFSEAGPETPPGHRVGYNVPSPQIPWGNILRSSYSFGFWKPHPKDLGQSKWAPEHLDWFSPPTTSPGISLEPSEYLQAHVCGWPLWILVCSSSLWMQIESPVDWRRPSLLLLLDEPGGPGHGSRVLVLLTLMISSSDEWMIMKLSQCRR